MPSEFHVDLGPLKILRSGNVWAVDLWRLRVYGVGLRWRYLGALIVRPGE